MSVFAYDPSLAKSWASNVLEYLNGGSESIAACSAKFNEQVEKLVQPNVWTGTAAKQNYQNFLTTHEALVNFVNNFGTAFENAMNQINKSVGSLEAANLGSTSSTANFGSLNYTQIAALSEANITSDVVRYNYTVIADVGANLRQIETTLEGVNGKLIQKISELNNGSSIWDGNAAQAAREELTRILNTNMQKVKEALNICITNIANAAQAAQGADQA